MANTLFMGGEGEGGGQKSQGVLGINEKEPSKGPQVSCDLQAVPVKAKKNLEEKERRERVVTRRL